MISGLGIQIHLSLEDLDILNVRLHRKNDFLQSLD